MRFLVRKNVLIPALILAVLMPARGAQNKRTYSSSPLTQEQLSVYRGFIDKFSELHIKNISKITLPLDFKGFPAGRPCLTGIELENPPDAVKTSRVFGPGITIGRELTLVDPVEQTKLLKQRNTMSSNQPKQSAPGGSDLRYLVFSEIAFDIKHNFAVLKYLLVCGEHCESGATLVMEKIDGRWTVSSRRPCAMFVN